MFLQLGFNQRIPNNSHPKHWQDYDAQHIINPSQEQLRSLSIPYPHLDGVWHTRFHETTRNKDTS